MTLPEQILIDNGVRIEGAMLKRILRAMEQYAESEYERGWTEATKEACDEISKNYHPNK